MHRHRTLLALALAVLAASTAVVAASAAGQQGKALFRYTGRLTATPAAGAGSISVSVETGNKRALRSLLGHGQTQSFAVGARTEYLSWSNGVPHVVGLADLHAGDWVTVNVRAAGRSSLDEVEHTAAGIVGDRGASPTFARLPLFLFTGRLAAPAVGGDVSVAVTGGNRIALRRLLGHSTTQTFAYGDGTIFLHWEGKVPTVTSPEQLTVGSRIVVRIRAQRSSTLDQLLATPAARVAEHVRAGR